MKKLIALAIALSCLTGGMASAYDMNALAAKTLPERFSYRAIPGEEVLDFAGQQIPYAMGQLSVTLKRSQKFASGYIIQSRLPVTIADEIRPFFRFRLGEREWDALIRMNRALLTRDSHLRREIERTMKNLAVNAMGPVAEEKVSVEISHIEPFRRLESNEAYVYTAGGLITFNAQGLIYPMYCRAYFFPDGAQKEMEVMMLLAPDEGKGPLVYALDDLAKEAAREELIGSEGYKDLGVILGEAEKAREIRKE